MDWEEIEQRARRMVVQIFGELSGDAKSKAAGQLAGQRDEGRLSVNEFLETVLLQQEKARRDKYDYRVAYRRLVKEKRRRVIRRVSTAAACIVLAAGSAGLYLNRKSDKPLPESILHIDGRQQVVLVLSNGESVRLDGKDTLQLEEGDRAIQIQQGRIAYQALSDKTDDPVLRYNTLTVPCGAEYRLELADGTKVHLNADSELKYPVAFVAGERKVELRGEAWFEVAKDDGHPFYVLADGIQIRVYGTTFNVNTHRLQSIQTVLVEGSVGIKAEGMSEELQLYPGQLADYNREYKQIQVKRVNVLQYTAWREGFFYFNDETLEDILNALARWYDLDVFFRSNRVKELHFTGHLARYEDIRKILSTVTESTGVQFQITDKTIVVR